ncbi:LuxR C-terminal-related transcriptional regulator [Micromonosporaceae bacterium DT55]|uniref:LuxR C-terminal-related transcriptional regulator n=1 Tax=Melissospora conviva TaxID=3388432 RepID=UPI003C28E849
MTGTPSASRPKMHIAGASPVSSPAQHSLLRAVAVATAPCELWFLEQMLDLGGVATGTSIDGEVETLISRGVLNDSQAGLRLTSRRLRDGVLRGIPPSLLAALQERAALVQVRAGRPTAAARHLLGALREARRVDPELVSRVATDAAVDPALAADLLLAACDRDAAGHDTERRRDWLLAAVDHLMLAGRSGEAMEQLHREIAADRHGPAYRCMLFGRLGACYATERPSLALDYLDRALRRPDHDPVHRAWTLTTTAVVAARVGHPRAAQLMEAAGFAHGDAPSPGGEIRLALARAAHAAAAGSAPTAGRILRTADPDSVSARTQAAFLRTERIAGQLTLGEFATAGAAIEAAAGEIGTLGAAAAPTLTALDCIARLAVGELPEAEARARLALRAPQRLPDEVRADLLAVVVEVLFRRGETTAARDLIDAQSPPVSWPDHLQWFRFGCAAAADPQPARHGELVRRTLWMPDRTLRPLLLVPHHAPRLVRAARLLGDHRRAGAISGHVKRIAGRVNNQLWRGVAHHVDGLVSGDPAALRAAVSRLRTTDARPALADALFDLAAANGSPPDEAAAAAQECAAVYTRLGALGDQDRASRLAHGLGHGPRPREPRPGHGLAALTAGEERVAELLARGATKQQAAAELYVSFHTVDTHLRAVYAKLGIRSRVELARVWDTHRPSR